MKNKISGKLLGILLVLSLMLSLGGCSLGGGNDIVVLFTGDTASMANSNIGYSSLLAYKKAVLQDTPNVALVDLGNAIHGRYIGVASKGAYVVDLMNKVGYDFATMGSHEFDYGLERFNELTERAKAQYLSCNITYTGENKEDSLLKNVKPYVIKEYGGKKLAFIGVSSPKIMTKTSNNTFKEGNSYAYDFEGGDTAEKFVKTVQGYVNECRNKKADYVILLSNMGDSEENTPFRVSELIGDIFDVDVVLDAGSGTEISNRVIRDSKNADVVLSSAGADFTNIGKLIISQNGNITTALVSGYSRKDSEIDSYYSALYKTFDEDRLNVVATSDAELARDDEYGIRTIKNRETPLGNLCADAYRVVSGANVAFVTADRFYSYLPIGDITYSDVFSLFPGGDTLCMVEATGEEISDALEMGMRTLEADYEKYGKPIGQSDSFLHVSGLKFNVDTSVKSTVVLDEYGMFKGVSGKRRVKNVQVLDSSGNYIPIKPTATYKVASNSYLMLDNGGGINIFNDNERLIENGMSDYQVIINYLSDYLDGKVASKYSKTDGRIIVK